MSYATISVPMAAVSAEAAVAFAAGAFGIAVVLYALLAARAGHVARCNAREALRAALSDASQPTGARLYRGLARLPTAQLLDDDEAQGRGRASERRALERVSSPGGQKALGLVVIPHRSARRRLGGERRIRARLVTTIRTAAGNRVVRSTVVLRR